MDSFKEDGDKHKEEGGGKRRRRRRWWSGKGETSKNGPQVMRVGSS